MPIADEIVESLFKKATKQGLGKALKKGIESSASKDLAGMAYENGIIKKIIKGSGDWRYIQLEDGSEKLVHKRVVNSLARETGTTKYINQFDAANEESKLAQAYKSLQLHMPKASKQKELIIDWHNNYSKQLKLAGKQTPELSLVKKNNMHFSLPTKYAKLLEKEGALKIIKSLK